METNRSRPSADEENKMDLLKKGAAHQLSSKPPSLGWLSRNSDVDQDFKECVSSTEGSQQGATLMEDEAGSVFSIFKKVRSWANVCTRSWLII